MRKPVTPARVLTTPHIAVLIVAAIVVPLTASALVWAEKGVTVIIDGEPVHYTTEAKTVSQVLKEVDIELEDGDIVEPALETPVTDGTSIIVRQAVPVTLERNGEPIELRVVGSTVADALVAAGLDPTVGLAVDPPVDTELSEEMTITATDMFVRVIQEEAEIPFSTVEELDPTMLKGRTRVVQEGAPGRAVCIFEVLVVGSVETTRTVKSQDIRVAPVPRIVKVGSKVPPPPRIVLARASGDASSQVVPGGQMRVVATAYTPWDPGCSGSVTTITNKLDRWNVPDGWGIVAVDPTVIKLGTKMYVPGYGYAVAADTGGAIKGNIIDVCFWNGGKTTALNTARLWGRRTLTVTFVR